MNLSTRTATDPICRMLGNQPARDLSALLVLLLALGPPGAT